MGGECLSDLCAYFNPCSPCGERRQVYRLAMGRSLISIHTPRMGSDYALMSRCGLDTISIHAPRMGSDCKSVV